MKKSLLTLLALCLLCTSNGFAWPLNVQEKPLTQEVTLYFPVVGVNYLGSERRTIEYSTALPFETALIQALIAGPQAVSPHLERPFQPGLEVLSTAQGKEILFVTFNNKIYFPFPGEQNKNQKQKLARRQLAMDALVNTITENTTHPRVQVLVDNQESIDISMRLNGGYFFSLETEILPPFTRNELAILSPSAACQRLLSCWQGKREDIPSNHLVSTNIQTLNNLPLLLSYEVFQGTIASDPLKAIVCVSLTVQNDRHQAIEINRYPLRTVYQNGFWVVDGDSFGQLLLEVVDGSP